MADDSDKDKSQDPTQKRLDDAHRKGDVVKSQEVSTWFVMAGATLLLGMVLPRSANDLARWLSDFLARVGELSVDAGSLRRLFLEAGLTVGGALLLPLGTLLAAAVAGNLVQHRFVWSVEKLAPQFEKISPIAGFKRLFSKDSLVNVAKGLLKLVAVATLMVAILWPEADQLDTIIALDVAGLMEVTRQLALKLMLGVVALLAVLAGADYLWQRQRWFERQKMTHQEIKEEYRQSEGDPAVKAKIRELRMRRSRRRMMAKVPEASVVITNPTHFAVALKYEAGMPAPVCLAKGADTMAFKIREIASARDVPIVENPPLARALYAQVELDQEIPPEHYRAVAEVISFVMRSRKRRRWRPA